MHVCLKIILKNNSKYSFTVYRCDTLYIINRQWDVMGTAQPLWFF